MVAVGGDWADMITIKGAREHNLKHLDVEIGDGITAVTGVSGSGKTSLVFDTLYHEARRRFLEIYALGDVAQRLAPADVDSINGVGPAVALGQNLLNRNPNSTLASATGLAPLLRILYARFGRRACPECGQKLFYYSEDEAVERLVEHSGNGRWQLFAVLVRRAPGSHATLLGYLHDKFGTEAVRVDGEIMRKSRDLDADEVHEIAIMLGGGNALLAASAAREMVQQVRMLGSAVIDVQKEGCVEMLSLAPVCGECGHWFDALEPTHFNRPCAHCQGNGCDLCAHTGLMPEAAAVRWQDLLLTDLLAMSVGRTFSLFNAADLPLAAERLQREIEQRLRALDDVGLGYLSLDRASPTLSRGEAQRTRLAVSLTSQLEDMLHVFDEPTIGQHAADTERFLPVLRALPGPVVYVEHDKAAVAAADQVIDLGPGAGEQGGRIEFAGEPVGLWAADTASGRYFSGRAKLPKPVQRPDALDFLRVKDADLHNLQKVTVRFPLGRVTAVTGVSGSGKSTLVEGVLAKSLSSGEACGCTSVEGPLLKPIMVDQSPIGRNPRSNPATYTKLADIVRDLFAGATGLTPSHFSFNRPEGACPSCSGMGAIEIKMRYLPSSWIPCVTCDGRRFKDEVLAAEVDFDGRQLNIAQFYRLTVSETLPLIDSVEWLAAGKRRAARRILEALYEIGLGYLTLGQPSPSLSGGEAQRVKLARFLGRRSLDRQVLLLDEPTTGLHEQDVAVLLAFLSRLVEAGGTVIAVEHNLDFIRAADWIIDLGPGAGPDGGQVLFEGQASRLQEAAHSLTAGALLDDERKPAPDQAKQRLSSGSASIVVRKARVHNLQGIDVTLRKNKLTAVTGVSGSGKSSLVKDVLEVEARRRFLETLSLYERQTAGAGSEADVDSVSGLGVTVAIDADGRQRFDQRATVGTATELTRHLAALLAWKGKRLCLACGSKMTRVHERFLDGWRCANCGAEAVAEPRLFLPTTYAAACITCNGVGTLQIPNPKKLIADAQKPLCGGAMHSPGFFPKGYLCKPLNHGYYMVRALGERYGFDPAQTAWSEMSEEAKQAFLFGDEKPILVRFKSRTQEGSREIVYPGFYGFIRDWDVGGTYTDTRPCPACGGAQLRPESLAVSLGGHNMYQLSSMPLEKLFSVTRALQSPEAGGGAQETGTASLNTVNRRLSFLIRVGLDYLHLGRPAATLSAGEAQRIRLAGLLGSGLRWLTILVDEPTRGMHSSEVGALIETLKDLRDEGNTVIVVEHDVQLIRAADEIIDIGPGAGRLGGHIVAQGAPELVAAMGTVTGRWLRDGDRLATSSGRRTAKRWLTIKGARANNLLGDEIRIPLRVLTGICGVSGSGKSSLLIDTIGRALAPKKLTTSVAYEPLEPGEYAAIAGAPKRTIVVDQKKAGVTSPLSFLGLERPLRQLYAATADGHALGISEKDLQRKCSACKGRGLQRFDMGFLPAVRVTCEVCRGSGYMPEAWQILWQGICLPELVSLTIEEAYQRFQEEAQIARRLAPAVEVGLGYLVLRQPGATLSGGEAQRLKIAKELARSVKRETLFILDEPTVGLHQNDVQVLLGVFERLVAGGHSVVVIEHHLSLLASCDWLIELGPGGGPEGGHLIGAGRPEQLAVGDTPTAPFLSALLGLPAIGSRP